MNRFLVAFVFALAMAGCTPAAVKQAVKENALRCERFAELIEEGETTREQEQRFIQANGKAWKALSERWE